MDDAQSEYVDCFKHIKIHPWNYYINSLDYLQSYPLKTG